LSFRWRPLCCGEVRVLIIPSNALQCADDPRLIIHAEGNAVAVAEFKLRQIAVQMLFGAMLIAVAALSRSLSADFQRD
jgi:hypothetical protein